MTEMTQQASEPDAVSVSNARQSHLQTQTDPGTDQFEDLSISRPSTSGDAEWTDDSLPEQDQRMLDRTQVLPATTQPSEGKLLARPESATLEMPSFSYTPIRPSASSQVEFLGSGLTQNNFPRQQQSEAHVEHQSHTQALEVSPPTKLDQTGSKKRPAPGPAVSSTTSRSKPLRKKKKLVSATQSATTSPNVQTGGAVSQPTSDLANMELDFTSGVKPLRQTSAPLMQSNKAISEVVQLSNLVAAGRIDDRNANLVPDPNPVSQVGHPSTARSERSRDEIVARSEIPELSFKKAFDCATTELRKWGDDHHREVQALESKLQQSQTVVKELNHSKDRLRTAVNGLGKDFDIQRHTMAQQKREIESISNERERFMAELASRSTTIRDLQRECSTIKGETIDLLREWQTEATELQICNKSLTEKLSVNVGVLSEERDRSHRLSEQLNKQIEASTKLKDSLDNKLREVVESLAHLPSPTPAEDMTGMRTEVGDILKSVQIMQIALQERTSGDDQIRGQNALLQELHTS